MFSPSALASCPCILYGCKLARTITAFPLFWFRLFLISSSHETAKSNLINDKNISIDIIEKDKKVGRKILLTGNGKGNISNQNVSVDKYNNSFVLNQYNKSVFLAFDITKTDSTTDGNIFYIRGLDKEFRFQATQIVGSERKLVTCVVSTTGAVYFSDLDANATRVYGTLNYSY